MNLRDATKIINKADTGITLNRSEQKLAELMLHSHSQQDMMRNISSVQDFLRQNQNSAEALIDFNAISDSKNQVAVKDIEDSDLHHVLKVIVFSGTGTQSQGSQGRGWANSGRRREARIFAGMGLELTIRKIALKTFQKHVGYLLELQGLKCYAKIHVFSSD